MAKPTLSAVTSELPEPPYPSDTKAGSFAFDIETDRMMASDTWALTPTDVRPWCLMSWVMSWTLIPCGSLPNDDDVISARLGCSSEFLGVHRKNIMRGWVLHSDDRLYHPVVTEKVLDFLASRDKWRKKWSKKNRKKLSEDSPESLQGVSGDSPGTLGVLSGCSRSSSSSSSSSSPKEKKERTIPRIGTNPVTGTETANRPKPIAAPVTVQPPTDLDPDLWHEFLAIRKKLKAQNTPRALELLKSKIERIKAETGETPNAIVERSIESSWKTVYPANSQKPNQATTPRKERDVW